MEFLLQTTCFVSFSDSSTYGEILKVASSLALVLFSKMQDTSWF